MTKHRTTRHLLINVVELRRRLGERMDVELDVILPPLEVLGSRLVDDEPVVGSVTIDSIERGVSMLGSVRFAWIGECRRCLDDVGGVMDSQIDEIYQVHAPEDSDIIDFDGEEVDLLPLVRDAVLIGLPLAPLCRDDCAGPDPERYPAISADAWERQQAAAAAAEPVPDPRWAALGDIDLT